MAYGYYLREKDPERALRECEAALKQAPRLADAHNLRGVLLERSGRAPEALESYSKALKLDPGLHEAGKNFAALRSEFEARDNLVTVSSSTHPAEAHILRMKLESEGIRVFVADEETVAADLMYSNAVGGVKLKVRPEDAIKAYYILYPGAADAESPCGREGRASETKNFLSRVLALLRSIITGESRRGRGEN